MNGRAYYNENDPFVAAWLKELIKKDLIAAGEVDERSIEDVRPNDLRGFTQCHFFAGIGGWSYALRLAGWPDDRPVWTGSCPCQPWSMAGKGAGADDSRHLWPTWFRLIRECEPATVFGEQVSSPNSLYWIDLVYADMEGQGYSVGAIDICAAGIGAPHIRQRLYFVGERAWSNTNRWGGAMPMGRCRYKEEASSVFIKARSKWTTEPRPPVLADGISSRVDQCNAYGNAIVPQVAAEFIRACMTYE